MAGDWLKVEKTLPEKPEVWVMAGELDLDPDTVVGKLIRVFSWFDEHTEDGNAPSVTAALLDRLVGVTGFTNSMRSCGWLVDNGENICLRNFERHNGKSAKTRALGRKRQEKHRNENVTQEASPEKRREEKRREEIKRFKPPTPEQVADYLAERGATHINPNRFVDHYTANGWKVGKTPMKDWQAAVRGWIARENDNGKTQSRTPQDTRRLTPGERTQLARERAYERERLEREPG